MCNSKHSLKQIKKTTKNYVERDDFQSVLKLLDTDKRCLSALYSMTYDKTTKNCWRAINYIGRIIGSLAIQDYDAARGFVRRILWDVTEESGTIGWSAPEILGEIIRQNPEPFLDIIPILMNLDEPMFQAGILYALGRIGEKHPELVKDHIHLIDKWGASNDNEICANAKQAAKMLAILK